MNTKTGCACNEWPHTPQPIGAGNSNKNKSSLGICSCREQPGVVGATNFVEVRASTLSRQLCSGVQEARTSCLSMHNATRMSVSASNVCAAIVNQQLYECHCCWSSVKVAWSSSMQSSGLAQAHVSVNSNRSRQAHYKLDTPMPLWCGSYPGCSTLSVIQPLGIKQPFPTQL